MGTGLVRSSDTDSGDAGREDDYTRSSLIIMVMICSYQLLTRYLERLLTQHFPDQVKVSSVWIRARILIQKKIHIKIYTYTNTLTYYGNVQIISPVDPFCRGSQLSLTFSLDMEQVHDRITAEGVRVQEHT